MTESSSNSDMANTAGHKWPGKRKGRWQEGRAQVIHLSYRFPVDVEYIHFSVLCNAIAVSLRLLVRFLCFFFFFYFFYLSLFLSLVSFSFVRFDFISCSMSIQQDALTTCKLHKMSLK